MKRVKRISVEVRYMVDIYDVDIPEVVYSQIVQANKNNDIIFFSDGIECSEWLYKKTGESDFFDWGCEICDIDEDV
ncbi:hypothetical protein HN014_08045 [Aquimarina sp. TRL1]|uniref:hypothetical protein n=1 Tax=Aquimarina sp. (strain TRL1) TaxID=2736252 RepID=UPI00158996B2|nr:hypothetical protein [Aquimarina sp. TRL1]QKX04869.1 hypothetical protein HN014_08045 [Aquimarina sp. TRL1]